MPKIEMNMPEPPLGWEYDGLTKESEITKADPFTMTVKVGLRKIKPATVMVELPWGVAEHFAGHKEKSECGWDNVKNLVAPCQAALAKE